MINYKTLTAIIFFYTSPIWAKEIKIAAILKLQDAYVTYPKDMLSSMKFALSDAKEKPEIIFESFSHDGTPSSIEKSINEAKNFRPDIVVAGETSLYAMTIAKSFQDTIFITPTASTEKMNLVHPNPIRMIHTDNQYVKIVEYILKNRNFKKIGIIHNLSYPNTERIGEHVKSFLTQQNIPFEVATTQSGEDITQKDLQRFITQKVDLVILFSFETDLRKTYLTLHRHNINPLYIGSDGWGRDSGIVENILKKNGNNFYGVRSLYWRNNRSDNFFKNTIRALESFTQGKVDAFHAIGFDTMKLIIDNLNKDKNLKNFIKNIKEQTFIDFLTTEKLRFSNDLSPIKDLYLYEIKNNQINYLKKI